VQSDGFKPREERGWEEYHPDLDLEGNLPVFSAEMVDGTPAQPAASPNLPNGLNGDGHDHVVPLASPGSAKHGESSPPVNSQGQPDPDNLGIVFAPPKRKPGRPFKYPQNALKALMTPKSPNVVPPPEPNVKEKLTLPKPSFRRTDPFSYFEQKSTGQQRYIDRSMANVGYQESDLFPRPMSRLIRVAEGSMEEDLDLGPGFKTDGEGNTALGGGGVGKVEYDMDEQDDKWLSAYNALRKGQEVEPITREVFEITMTKIEKEWHALEKRGSPLLPGSLVVLR
jgi:NuA3 HAT complex component NTO1